MPASASSTKWRLHLRTAANGGPQINIAEFALFTNGTNLCTGGTATASSASGVQTANLAFDGDPDTYWLSASELSWPTTGWWLQYEFPSPVTDPTHYTITAPTAASIPTPTAPSGRAPSSWHLQFWNGSVWVDYDIRTGQTSSSWANAPAKTFVTFNTTTPITSLPLLSAPVTMTLGQVLWFVYTADVTDVLGLTAYSDAPSSNFVVSLFTPYFGVPYIVPPAVRGPIQFPVTAGQTYYIKITNATVAAPTTRDMILSIIRGPVDSVPVGSLFVHDDSAGFPLAILSQTTGAVIRFRQPVASGEYADVLPDGRYLIHDNHGGTTSELTLRLYSGQTALLGSIAYGPTPSAQWMPIRSNKSNAFYVGVSADADHTNKISFRKLFADTLTFGPTTWVAPAGGLTALAPSLDETILYYAAKSTAAPIKRWDLVNNVALTDLAPGIALLQPDNDILVLNDGTILAAYWKPSTGGYSVTCYAADGTILHTYTFGTSPASFQDIMLAYALDDPVSFWVWLKSVPINGYSRFQNIRVSDGGVLTTFDTVDFEAGRVLATIDPAGAVRFGQSRSCHFFIMRQAIAAPVVVPLCVQGCIPSLGAIAGGGQGCLSPLAPGTGGGQGCSLPTAPDVECA